MLFLFQILMLAVGSAAVPSVLYSNTTTSSALVSAVALPTSSSTRLAPALSASTLQPVASSSTHHGSLMVSSAGLSSSSLSNSSSVVTTSRSRHIATAPVPVVPVNTGDTASYPCNCRVVVPAVSFIQWVPVFDSSPRASPTVNAAGTSITTITSYGTGFNGQRNDQTSMITLAFPTQFYDYDYAYFYNGTTSGATAGTAACSAIPSFTMADASSYLPSHPVFDGDAMLAQPTAPADDSFGLQHRPKWVVISDQSEWFRSEFPSEPLLHLCPRNTNYTFVNPAMLPQLALTKASFINPPSSGPAVAQPASTPAPDLAAPTSLLVVLSSAAGHLDAPLATQGVSSAIMEPKLAPGGTQTSGTSQVQETSTAASESSHFSPEATGNAVSSAQLTPDSSSSKASRLDLGAAVVSAAKQAASASVANNAGTPSQTAIVLADVTVNTSAAPSEISNHALTPGASLNVDGGADTTVIVVSTNAQGATVVRAGASTITLPRPSATRVESGVFMVAGQTISAKSDALVVASQTLRPGTPVTIEQGAATQIVSVQTNSAGLTVIHAGGSTIITLSTPLPTHIGPSAFVLAGQTISASSSAFVVAGQTLRPGTPVTIEQGPTTQVVRLQTNGAGMAEIIAGSVTTTLSAGAFYGDEVAPSSTLTFAGQTLTFPNGAALVQGQTLTPQKTATFIDGTRATTVAVKTDASGRTELVVDGSTTFLPGITLLPQATLTYAGVTLTEVAGGGIAVGGQTLRPGASATIGSGSQVTTVAVHTGTLGQTELIVDRSTTTLAPPLSSVFTFAGQGFTELANGRVIVQGETVSIGGSASVTGAGGNTIIVGLKTNAAGATELVVGSSTTIFHALFPIATAAVLTAGGLTFTPIGSSALLVEGQTLALGSTITLGFDTQTTHVALKTNSLGQTELVEGSSTIMLRSEGIGGYIMSGLGGTFSTTASRTTEAVVTWSSVQSSPAVAQQTSGGGRLISPSRFGAMISVSICTWLVYW